MYRYILVFFFYLDNASHYREKMKKDNLGFKCSTQCISSSENHTPFAVTVCRAKGRNKAVGAFIFRKVRWPFNFSPSRTLLSLLARAFIRACAWALEKNKKTQNTETPPERNDRPTRETHRPDTLAVILRNEANEVYQMIRRIAPRADASSSCENKSESHARSRLTFLITLSVCF